MCLDVVIADVAALKRFLLKNQDVYFLKRKKKKGRKGEKEKGRKERGGKKERRQEGISASISCVTWNLGCLTSLGPAWCPFTPRAPLPVLFPFLAMTPPPPPHLSA